MIQLFLTSLRYISVLSFLFCSMFNCEIFFFISPSDSSCLNLVKIKFDEVCDKIVIKWVYKLLVHFLYIFLKLYTFILIVWDYIIPTLVNLIFIWLIDFIDLIIIDLWNYLNFQLIVLHNSLLIYCDLPHYFYILYF